MIQKTIKRNILILISGLICMNSFSDEGMWMINQIYQIDTSLLKKNGLELPISDIYNSETTCLKDAIVMFNGSCSGSVISPNGLLLTNHHCGFKQIRNLSSNTHNYLKNGYWADDIDDELPSAGLTVSFLRKIVDVSQEIFKELSDDMALSDRNLLIKQVSNELINNAVDDVFSSAVVKSVFGGNQYYLFIYEEYRDVRFVGAPPVSVGKFGFDEDNWEWPRYNADFSLFRVYTSPDGSPAEYSPENIPLKTDSYLPVSIKGINENEFTMILGYPGKTRRFSSSFEISEAEMIINPIRAEIRDVRQKVLAYYMDESPDIALQYSEKYYKSSNYWKKAIGQNTALERFKIQLRKQNAEKDFLIWTRKDSLRHERYGDIIQNWKSGFELRKNYRRHYQYIDECFFRAVDLTILAHRFRKLEKLLYKNDDDELISQELDKLRIYCNDFFNQYNKEVDRHVASEIFQLYHQRIPLNQQPEILKHAGKKYKGNLSRFVEKLYKKSWLTDKEKIHKFLENPDLEELRKDIGYQVSMEFYGKILEIYQNYYRISEKLKEADRLYFRALQEYYPDSLFYPDANSTMRFSYGKATGYRPFDAVKYDFATTSTGLLQKVQLGEDVYVLPDKFHHLLLKNDFSRYADSDELSICFITNNDITGGNSGSPVLNGRGELVGLAFDTNWEGLSGDLFYEPDYQRCISVDIRYVLFIIDQYAGVDYLLDEMLLIDK